MRFAQIVFRVAGVWGVVILTPLYFMFDRIGRDYPPPITHPEMYVRLRCRRPCLAVRVPGDRQRPGSIPADDDPGHAREVRLHGDALGLVRAGTAALRPACRNQPRPAARPAVRCGLGQDAARRPTSDAPAYAEGCRRGQRRSASRGGGRARAAGRVTGACASSKRTRGAASTRLRRGLAGALRPKAEAREGAHASGAGQGGAPRARVSGSPRGEAPRTAYDRCMASRMVRRSSWPSIGLTQ